MALTDLVQEHLDHARNNFSPEERMLVTLRDELYNGSWKEMKKDLKDRLKARPYIFMLANRIEKDLDRIEKIEGYELKHGIDLAEYVKKIGEEEKAKTSPY